MQINLQSLTDKISLADISSFYKAKPSKNSFFEKYGFMIMCIAIFLTVFSAFVVSNLVLGASTTHVDYILFAIAFILMIVAVTVSVRSRIIKTIRMVRFAKDNGLNYLPMDNMPNEKGVLFNIGGLHQKTDIISCPTKGGFEIGNYHYAEKSDSGRKIISRGYIKVRLTRSLPQIVLDSKANNTRFLGIAVSSLPISYNKNQILSLEGDFNSYFTLYAPKDCERDALYIFSPDLMELFIDKLGNYDAEIVDDNLYIYAKKAFNMLDSNVMQRLFLIIGIIGTKNIFQTGYNLDLKTIGSVDLNLESGKRLMKRVSHPFVVVTIIFMVFCLLLLIAQYYIRDIMALF